MNILKRYIEEGDERRREYAYNLIMLYDYLKLFDSPGSDLTDEEKNEYRTRANEIRDEMAQYIMKGMK